MPRPRTLTAVALAAVVTLTTPLAASAADSPPTTSTGFVGETWGAPVSNDLFSMSASSWSGVAGLGGSEATLAAVTVTAVQDLTLTMQGWYSGPNVVSHLSGTCPRSVFSPSVAMRAGEQCSYWLTYAEGALGTWHSYITGLNLSATAADGTSATAYYGQSLSTQHLVVGDPIDFGAVPFGDTAEDGFALTNISPHPIDVDLTGIPTGGFSLADDQPGTLTMAPGETVRVGVAFSPRASGTTSTWARPITAHAVGSTVSSRVNAPTLTGTGVDRHAELTAEPIDFGTVDRGSTATRPLVITNTGGVPLRVTATVVDDLQVTLPDAELAPGGTLTGTVTWQARTDLSSTWIELTGIDDTVAAGLPSADPARTETRVSGTVGTVVVDPTPTPTATDPQPEPEPAVTAPGPDRTPAVTTATDPTSAAPYRSGVLAVTGSGLALAGLALAASTTGTALLVLRRRARQLRP
ncbi:choice-of-anchor D domain-containing protein [Cellulomonas sp. RIT-PI-Y]|uniref:choice-of-anchor D domain-containing protein n=1 Tax=Cellulomonas sp. RIT-PI-Y TaxID=3035297 RepID=UPI0021D8C8AF|nr:choice-of-anchor D domain-containing protein [Cellulomonas sp. RIT-PI-Y]